MSLKTKELVPIAYDRTIYNQMHGTTLEHHDDQVTAEQAKRINDTFDIEINLGRHGKPVFTAKSSVEAIWGRPTESDYEAAAEVVASMQPGDTLYVEGHGFKDERAGMLPDHTHSDQDNAYMNAMERIVRKANVELMRNTGYVSAFGYAAELAALQGIRTIYADLDIFDRRRNETMADGKTLDELSDSRNTQERQTADHINEQRGRRAVSVLKDDALAQLPPEGSPVRHGRKPKLVMLFGAGHDPEIRRAVDDMGLDAKINMMKTKITSDQIHQYAGDIAASQVESLIKR